MKPYFKLYTEPYLFENTFSDEDDDLSRDVWTPEELWVGRQAKRVVKKTGLGMKTVAVLGAAGLAGLGFGAFKLVKYIKKKNQIRKMLKAETDPVKKERLRFELKKLNQQEVAEKYKLKVHQKRLAKAKLQKVSMLKDKLKKTHKREDKLHLRAEIAKLEGKKFEAPTKDIHKKVALKAKQNPHKVPRAKKLRKKEENHGHAKTTFHNAQHSIY